MIISGVQEAFRKGRDPSSCSNNYLQGKIDVNLPLKYRKNIFCAQNPTELEATCPGDSGKHMKLMLINKTSITIAYFANISILKATDFSITSDKVFTMDFSIQKIFVLWPKYNKSVKACNFKAIWPTDSIFTELKDLNLLKNYNKNQEASRILRVGFALSKWPHLHRAYLVTVPEYLSQSVKVPKVALWLDAFIK